MYSSDNLSIIKALKAKPLQSGESGCEEKHTILLHYLGTGEAMEIANRENRKQQNTAPTPTQTKCHRASKEKANWRAVTKDPPQKDSFRIFSSHSLHKVQASTTLLFPPIPCNSISSLMAGYPCGLIPKRASCAQLRVMTPCLSHLDLPYYLVFNDPALLQLLIQNPPSCPCELFDRSSCGLKT